MRFIVVLLWFGVGWGAEAQRPLLQQNIQPRLYEAYATGQIEKWTQVIQDLKNNPQLSESAMIQYELVFALYGYMGYCLEHEIKSEVKQYLDEAIELAKALSDTLAYQAAGNAFLGTFYAFEMRLSTYKIPFLAPKSMAAMNRAGTADSTNVHYLVEHGNQLFYSPAIFGGDKLAAITFYRKALAQMKQSDYFVKSWLRVYSYKQLERGYRATDQEVMADKTYRQMVQLFPECKRKSIADQEK